MAQRTAQATATMVTLPESPTTPTNNNERSPIPASASSPSLIADEDVVRDILEELDRERSKRAELELKIRQLVEAAQQTATAAQTAAAESSKQERKSKDNGASGASDNKNMPPSSHDYLAMQTQVEGYQQLVDELTKGKPAIAAAAKNEKTSGRSNGSRSNSRIHNNDSAAAPKNKQTLPLYLVRLLEVIPWDPRAREHIFGTEEVYEWQVYDKRERKWQGHIRSFPSFFKALPVTRPKPVGNATIQETPVRDRSLLLFLAGGGGGEGVAAAPSKHGVLTNAALTQVLNIETGFPLPADGATWQWIGGWRVDKRVTIHHAEASDPSQAGTTTAPDASATSIATTAIRQKVDCDDNGWSYAREAQHFILNPTELAWDHPGADPPERRIRRRKWTRQRLLVDYPYASERTQNYLKLLAENARLSVTSSKISDQLVETKMTLTETEQELERIKGEAVRQTQQIEGLKTDLDLKDDLLREMGIPVEGNGSHGDGASGPLHEFLTKNEQVKEIIGSKLSQWVGGGSSVRKNGEDASVEGTSSQLDKGGAKSSEAPRFGWGKKFGGGALLEKMKQSQTNTTPGRSQQKQEESESAAVGTSLENESREDQSVEPEQGES
jgi:hypothetical protein